MTTKNDIIGSLVIGLFIGALFVFLSYATILVLRPDSKPPLYYWAALAVVPFATTIGTLVIGDLKRRVGGVFALGYQFYKFVLVGGLNTLIDLSVLNVLIVLSGIATGWEFSAFKGASFAVAVINSYFWNKFWTFRKSGRVGASEFGQFILISLVGLGLNVGAASLLVNVMGPQGGIDPKLWANVAAVSAIVFSTIWNFIGYKLIVFRKP